jgi:hypothetical protein
VLSHTFVVHDLEIWAYALVDEDRSGTPISLCKEKKTAQYLLILVLGLGVVLLVLIRQLS